MKAYLRSLVRRARCAWRGRTLVLAYHHVCAPSRTVPSLTVSPDRFAEQMAFLSRHRLAVPVDDLVRDTRNGPPVRGGRVVVTFDDASADFYEVAYPILRRHGVPATMFVPTGLVGSARPFWWNRLYNLGRAAATKGIDLYAMICQARPDLACTRPAATLWRSLRLLGDAGREEVLASCEAMAGSADGDAGVRCMNWEQIVALDRDGLITFGAHTVSHPVLSSLTKDRTAAEVFGSRDALGRLTCFRKVFAYPYGDASAIDDQVKRVVADAGFAAGLTTARGPVTGSEDRLTLPRVCVEDEGLGSFRWLIDRYLGRD